MKKVYNPTKEEVRIQLDGTVYSVKGESESENLDENIILRWKDVHNFLVIRESSVDSPKVEDSTEEEDKEEEVDIMSLKRDELDALATELQINPKDYSNKKDLAEAIAEVTGEIDEALEDEE